MNNPGIFCLLNPFNILANMRPHRELIVKLTGREVRQRYAGTFLGVLWSFITPLLMLVIYTAVFSLVMKARWSHPSLDEGFGQFALTLFAGLIPFNIFSEVVGRSPWIILASPNYVKKVVFPLEALPFVATAAAVIHSFFAVTILLLCSLLFNGHIPWTALLLPVAYLPLIFLCLGVTWFLSSLGVYLRDIGEGVKFFVQALMFLSPVFYPLDAAPPTLRKVLEINPLTPILTDFRKLLLWNEYPDWNVWGGWTLFSLFVMTLGYAWFIKTKKGFADVM